MPLFGLARGGECWGGFGGPGDLESAWDGPSAAAWGRSCGLPCPAQTEGEAAPCGGPDSAAVFYQVSSRLDMTRDEPEVRTLHAGSAAHWQCPVSRVPSCVDSRVPQGAVVATVAISPGALIMPSVPFWCVMRCNVIVRALTQIHGA
jgi:hypothetical protein